MKINTFTPQVYITFIKSDFKIALIINKLH